MKKLPPLPRQRSSTKKIRLAEVIGVQPAHSYMEGIVRRQAAEVVIVRERNSKIVHHFVTGSLNGIMVPEHRRVGVKGKVVWQVNTSFNLPFFVAAK